MKVTCATSLNADSLEAAREVVRAVSGGLGGARPDLAFLFVSRHHVPLLEEILAGLHGNIDARHLLGSTGEGIIGGRLEHENRPALALWASVLPNVEIASGHVVTEPTPEGPVFHGTPQLPEEPATLLLLGEPFSFDAEAFISRLSEDAPALQVVGGLSSGARVPGENRLVWNGDVFVDGAVALTLSGAIRVRALVSQGCRPFGRRLVVTKAESNLILELGGRPAVEKLNDQLSELPADERVLLQRGLHLGLAVDARKETHRRGDFLVRNVLGYAPEKGALLVTDVVRPGTTVQFHLRDADTASEDLERLLCRARESGWKPLGALLFSCNGRGSKLFHRSNHDAEAVNRNLGDVPLAGFFAAGEIGPVGGRSFLHGFTASLALFEDRT